MKLLMSFIFTVNILLAIELPHCSSFGEYSYIGGGLDVKSWGEGATFSVGHFCSIADHLTILLGGNHRVDWISTYPFMSFNNQFPEAENISGHPATKGNVIIGNDVWIGSHVVILSGIKIGDGAVIGAYSVVAKDVPPYAVAVGNPVSIVRYRFDEDTIKKLMEIAWWNWPIEKIKKYVKIICSNDIDSFFAVRSRRISKFFYLMYLTDFYSNNIFETFICDEFSNIAKEIVDLDLRD